MTKYFSFVILPIAIYQSIFSQNNLEPFNGGITCRDYYKNVTTALHPIDGEIPIKDVDRLFNCSILCLPSFSPEWLVLIEKEKSSNKYFINFEISEKSIYGMMMNNKSKKGINPKAIKVERSRKEIDKNTKEQLEKVFYEMISQSRYPNESTRGLDGTIYIFSAWGNLGGRSAEIWSPQSGNTQMLVNLTYLLSSYASCPSEETNKYLDLITQTLNTLQKQLNLGM
jgi:hypothetical protein